MFCVEAQDTNEKLEVKNYRRIYYVPERIEERRIAVRGYLTAVWRAMRWLAALMAFCQMLFDFIKEVRNTVQNQHRAGMRGNRLFYQGE